MAEHPMETTVRTALWRQFGAAIAMLENALPQHAVEWTPLE
jgi:hypothetical protein